MIPPRSTPDRDSRYMGLAAMIMRFSKDPSTQVGAVLVSKENKPLGYGYNGPPPEIDDESFSWERPHKNDYIEHAEKNAVDFSCGKVKGSTLYCTAYPCKSCMLYLVKKRIARVVYLDRVYDPGSSQADPVAFECSMDIARKGKIQVEVFQGDLNWIDEQRESLRLLHILK